jgi:xylulokinase
MRDKNKLLMGIDIGTSSCKVAIFGLDGIPQAMVNRNYDTIYEKPGWAEQNPEDWWRETCEAIKECLKEVNAENIVGIGVDGQSWSCVPVDEDGTVLANNPIWTDTRADMICQELSRSNVGQQMMEISGNPLGAGYTTGKLIWFSRERPEVFRKTAFFLQSNSFIVYRLTMVFSQDKSQCYGIHVYNITTGRMEKEICDAAKIDYRKLPPLYECKDIVGKVTEEAARLTGLKPGTPVVAGGLDAACGALGVGVCHPGDTQEQGGQAGGMSICLEHPQKEKRLILSNHVVDGYWLLQGGTIAGGAAMNWLAKTLGEYEKLSAEQLGIPHLKRMDQLAEKELPGSGGMVFLPYLSGERSPLWDTNACGMFFGIDFSTTRGQFYRAVMEGTAFALHQNLQTAVSAGVNIKSLNAMGGATSSDIWMQIKADITGLPVQTFVSGHYASTLGAALLAGVGTGCWNSFEDACSDTVRIQKQYVPNEQNKLVYQKTYEIYKELYLQTKKTMKKQWEIKTRGSKD